MAKSTDADASPQYKEALMNLAVSARRLEEVLNRFRAKTIQLKEDTNDE